MKKLNLLVLFSFLLSLNVVFSQPVKPIKIGIEVGTSIPQAAFSGSIEDYYTGDKYGQKTGFNFGVIGKINLLAYKLTGSINYSIFSNEGVASSDEPNSNIEVKTKVLTIGAGPEMNLSIPGSPIGPYVGLNFIMSFINGETTFSNVSDLPSGTITVAPATRFGVGFKAGAEIKLMKLTLDIGLKYNLVNLFPKKFVTFANGEKIDAYTNLNDSNDPSSSGGFLSSTRTIGILQINAGILF